MRKMKKALAVMLAATMTMSMGMTAFADEITYNNGQNALAKTYTVRKGSVAEEDFTFSFEGVSYENVSGETIKDATFPSIADVTISTTGKGTDGVLGEGTYNLTGDLVINADEFELGVYTYTVTENDNEDGNTSGVNYAEDETLYLVLTIMRNEDNTHKYVAALHYKTLDGVKSKGFNNVYDSGSLTVGKTITGNMARMDDTFTFRVTFDAETNTVFRSEIGATTENLEPTTDTDNKIVYEFTLGNDEKITFDNIPVNTTYTVEETSLVGSVSGNTYTQTLNDNSDEFTGTITNAGANVSVNNDYTNSDIDTGIVLDNAPYMLLLALAVLGMFGFISKKRSMEF